MAAFKHIQINHTNRAITPELVSFKPNLSSVNTPLNSVGSTIVSIRSFSVRVLAELSYVEFACFLGVDVVSNISCFPFCSKRSHNRTTIYIDTTFPPGLVPEPEPNWELGCASPLKKILGWCPDRGSDPVPKPCWSHN